MDPFWGITLSLLVLRSWWKSQKQEENERKEYIERQQIAIQKEAERIVREPKLTAEEREAEKIQRAIYKQKEKDINDLRRQGYTDELIAVILPTINHGQ